ncbi:uncharacterized protein TNCV_4322011 [Trichonephila clavipes]|uniref:Mutator-like transposase domain-containing protein n=1 Tax=Trichonephila clavipes TaxID=2585209 RepID=A0A8X6SHY9_TRICX|nr:uncharacterized protein TNCV_4322011 [Trichonephila clavipes]
MLTTTLETSMNEHEMNVKCEHVCSNYNGSFGNMEAVGAFRIFERSLIKRDLQYTEYYGEGDSKGFLQVKDIYVTKLECIGHIQKRVGSRLRKLKKNTKGLGGKGKLTDKFIDKLHNYYGIAIHSNVGCLEKMQSAVIAASFHCCSSNQNPMHGQCPTGKDNWCQYKQALCDDHITKQDSRGDITDRRPDLGLDVKILVGAKWIRYHENEKFFSKSNDAVVVGGLATLFLVYIFPRVLLLSLDPCSKTRGCGSPEVNVTDYGKFGNVWQLFGLLYPKNTSKVSLNQCRGVWQW